MKTIGIILLLFVGIQVLRQMNNTTKIGSIGLDKILKDTQNKYEIPTGAPQDFEKSFLNFRSLSKKELKSLLEKDENLNLHQVSNALLLMANTYLNEKDIDNGLNYLMVSADVYHNPIAQVALGRAYYTGFEDKDGKGAQDYEKAFYWIVRGFQTAGALHENTGEKFALDQVVKVGLGVYDAYQTAAVKKHFDYSKVEADMATQMKTHLENWAKMYQIEKRNGN